MSREEIALQLTMKFIDINKSEVLRMLQNAKAPEESATVFATLFNNIYNNLRK